MLARGISRVATYITNILKTSSNTTLANFLFLMILIYLVIDKALANVYDPQIGFCFANSMFVLLKIRKVILKITATLILASKKVS